MFLNVHVLAHTELAVIFTLGELRSKGTLYTCFVRIMLRWRTRSIVEMLTLSIP